MAIELPPYDRDEPLSMFPVVFASFVGAMAVVGLFLLGDDPQPVVAPTPKAVIGVRPSGVDGVRSETPQALADRYTIAELLERLKAMQGGDAGYAEALAVKHERGKKADRRRIVNGLNRLVAQESRAGGKQRPVAASPNVTIEELQQVTVGLGGQQALGAEAKALLAEVEKALQQIGEIEGFNGP